MIEVTVAYPAGQGRTFNTDYYLKTHIPLFQKSPSLPKIELGGADFGRKFSRQFPTAIQLEIAPLFLEIFEQKSLPTHQRIQPNCMDTA
jgi:hypothetical protein